MTTSEILDFPAPPASEPEAEAIPVRTGLRARLRSGARRVREAFIPSETAWNGAAAALLALWVVIFAGFVLDTFAPGYTTAKALGLLGLFALMAVVSVFLLLLLRLSSALHPRYRAALLLSFPPAAMVMLGAWFGGKGIVLGAVVLFTGLSLFCGAGVSLLASREPLRRRLGSAIAFAVGAVILGGALYGLFGPVADSNPALAGYHLRGQTLALPDPGQSGPYQVRTLTYGSGKDPLRPEYGSGVGVVTQSVDASKLDEQWTGASGWIRTLYWGFSPASFPVQGRVWMPAAGAAGPFPLVLIAHGNHDMEKFSEGGFAYLGEHLAGQGFIVVSADQNFLNTSMGDMIAPLSMRNGSENRVRAWLLLQHLTQWRRWNADPKSPFFGKVDLEHIGLIGHSRGGEAVAIAAAFNQLGRYPDDATIPFPFQFKLAAVAALAPIDGQYSPRDRPNLLRDVSYLVIHGSMDGDIATFKGASQYSRTSFSGPDKGYKASVYIKDANHGQFNTGWGRNDFGLPFGFLMDERRILDGDAQRRIAKVYLSAFFQSTLMGRDAYRPLFQDARNGAGWLPDDYVINNYADGATTWLANFEEDADPSTGSGAGVTIDGRNLSIWKESSIELKQTHLDSEAAVLAWDDRLHKQRAQFSIDLGKNVPAVGPGTELVFSASNAGIDSLPDEVHRSGDAPIAKTDDSKTNDDQPLDWSIVLADASGNEAVLPLSHDQLLYPQIKGETRRWGALDTMPQSEIVMRRYHFALHDFAAVNPKLDLAALKQIRFVFDKSPRGAIALDDVGLTGMSSKPALIAQTK
jgi:MFS family permease